MKITIAKIVSCAFLLIILAFSIAPVTFAQPTTGVSGGAAGNPSGGAAGNPSGGKPEAASRAVLQNPLKSDSIEELMVDIVSVAIKIGVIIAFLALLWVGFQFIVAQGNSDKISDARKHFFYVIIGIAILFGAEIIVQIIKATLSPFVDTGLLGK
ncbi:MAG: TrbC/VirB2 family protein [Patescibacteria group bacterium]